MPQNQSPSSMNARYPPGYFPHGMPTSQPSPPSRSPPSPPFHANVYSQPPPPLPLSQPIPAQSYQHFPQQSPLAGGDYAQSLYPPLAHLMPQNPPPQNPPPPSSPPYMPPSAGPAPTPPFPLHPRGVPHAYHTQSQYPYGQAPHLEGHATRRPSPPYNNSTPYPTYAHSGHPPSMYNQPAPPVPGWVGGPRHSPTTSMTPMPTPGHDSAPPLSTYGTSSWQYPGFGAPAVQDRLPGPAGGSAPSPTTTRIRRSTPPGPTAPKSTPPSQRPHGRDASNSNTRPHTTTASQAVLSSARSPPGLIVNRGTIPPPSDGILFEVLGGNLSKEEEQRVWCALDDFDRLRVISRRDPSQLASAPASAPSRAQEGSTQPPSVSAKRSGSKGKAKAMPVPPQSASASGPASGTYRSPYVEDVMDNTDASYTSSRAFLDIPSNVPSHHRSSVQPPPTIPVAPQGNHFGVVMLDAIHGLKGDVVRLETKIVDFVQCYAASPVPGGAHRATESGSSTMPRVLPAGRGDGYAADVEEDKEEKEATRLKAEIKAQKARDRPHTNRVKECLRKHMKYVLLKVKSTKALPSKFPPFSPEELAAYDSGSWSPISRDNYRVDFVAGWKTQSYNVDARQFFMEDFIREAKGGGYTSPPIPARFLTFDVVSKAVDNHMDYLRRQYKLYAAPMTPEHRVKLQRIAQRKRVNARKATTYQVRVRVIDRHELIQHKQLFDMLQPCHMSGDEAEVENQQDDRQTHPRVYIIVDAAWQSPELKTFVRTLEQWNIADWRQSVGDRLPGGNAPRTRVEKGQTRVVNSVAPKGLWRNCYSQKWLDSLTGPVRARLDVIEEDYDFSLPTYQKPAYIDPKDFPTPEEEDAEAEEAMENEEDSDSE